MATETAKNPSDLKDPDQDTVTLCTQTAYPGDDELESLEGEIVIAWKLDQPPDVEPSLVQDAKDTETQMETVRKCLAEGQQCDALVYVDRALQADFHNPALWLQRATVLIALGDLREAFRSCRVLSPRDRTLDMWKMGGSILDKLGLPLSAESWFRNATKTSARGDNSAAILFQKTRAKRLYAPLTRDTPVEVTFTSQGRALATTRAVKKGEVIFADKPMVLAQTLPTLKFVCCANCARSMIRPEDVFTKEELQQKTLAKALKKYWPIRDRFPCVCGHEVYCSEGCKAEAWDNYHRLICPERNPTMRRLYEVCESYNQLTSSDVSAFDGWWAASFSPILMAKLWAQVVSSACSLAKEKGRVGGRPSAQDWAFARAPYRRFIAFGSGIKADALPRMRELMSEIFRDLGDGLSYPIDKEEFNGRYLQMACNVQSFSDSDNPMGYLCRGLRSEQDMQMEILLAKVRHKEHDGDFAGLFPLHACLNHSCANNAVVGDGPTADGRPGCHVKAKRNIACGEEVCNQYIDISMSRKERRYYLYRSYSFLCQCTRCQFEGDGPESCTECEVKAPEGKNFPTCSRCKQAWYCSTKCQKKAWKRGHKKICGLEM
ncbi:protein-lysine N-trimethyltransferase SMYD5-like [Babylonia areolata]|uniref:protein-lysine N-trimethyltransferase SMYD5-like n=1 Tax=Babylonia areolata TaxID=304850 RepID=UPI003FD2F3C2